MTHSARLAAGIAVLLSVTSAILHASPQDRPRPKGVIVIITDDQGYGDVGAHGNSMIVTPNLDRLHAESVRLTDYHVDPTCSPTRAALMTGRYSTRTGVWHTIMGRSLMRGDELTVAEVFRRGGYRTGMFGKWHLGDNAPCRPQDQGFDVAYYHGGGGVGQTPDYFGNDYFDDTYFRHGVPEAASGYCTDVWFAEAQKFIAESARDEKPFFVYLSTNAPHGPFLVDEKYSRPYVEKGVPGTMAKFYGMITNIDENVGRLRALLSEQGLADDTLFVFQTDNGTAAGVTRGRRSANADSKTWQGFNAGMRGQKGSEYDGGHRVPFFAYWPKGGVKGGRDVDTLAAHIDVLPTLADLCGLDVSPPKPLDGASLASHLRGDDGVAWPDRTLFVHSQRIETPVKGRKSAVMTERYRLVNRTELYDIAEDPGQTKNIADDHPDLTKELRKAYDGWWASLAPSFEEPVRLVLGSEAENPARLTCHDWHTHNRGVPWNQGHIRRGPKNNGYWTVSVERAGKYEFTLRRWPSSQPGAIEATKARVSVGGHDVSVDVTPDASKATIELELATGPTSLQTWFTDAEGPTEERGTSRGAYFVDVRFLGAD